MNAQPVFFFGIFLALVSPAYGIDPIKDFLTNFSPADGHDVLYHDDLLLQLNVDIDGDGTDELLLAMARDRNGKQGNNWVVYKKSKMEIVKAGVAIFGQGLFYVGKIDEIGKHGLVTFFSGGAGQGVFVAHYFDSEKLVERDLGRLEWDKETNSFHGRNLLEKYGTAKVAKMPATKEMSAAEAGLKYGLAISPLSYQEALEEQRNKSMRSNKRK